MKTWMVPARSPKVMPRSTTSPSIWLNTGQVPGVGGVEPEALARHDGMDRQRALGHGLLHQVDLHRGGVRAQENSLGLAQVEVDGVVHAAGGVRGRDVEGLEVVPVRFGLASLRHGEAHADEDVLELGPGLGHQVKVATCRGGEHLIRDDLGEVETVAGQRRLPFPPGQFRPPGLDLRLKAGPGLVETAARLLALIGAEAPQAAMGPGERGPLAEELRLDLRQLRRGRRGRDRSAALGGQDLDVGVHVLSDHGWPKC